MIKTELKTLAEYSQCQFYGKDSDKDLIITGITTDSRKAAGGVLFACIKGERVDGHDYINKAREAGAAAVICEKAPDTDIPYILVDSTVKALQSIGFETIAVGDSYNDLGMIQASKAGFLFRSTEKIRADHPELPAFETYEDLKAAILAAL